MNAFKCAICTNYYDDYAYATIKLSSVYQLQEQDSGKYLCKECTNVLNECIENIQSRSFFIKSVENISKITFKNDIKSEFNKIITDIMSEIKTEEEVATNE